MYNLICDPISNGVIGVSRVVDGVVLSMLADESNGDYREFLAWKAEGNVPADPPPALAIVPETISDRQFAQALALAGTISQDEALAWAARGDLPKAMNDALAQIPEDGGQRFGARMMLSAATTYQRSHPLVPLLGSLLTNPATGQPYDAAALDALWTTAAAL